MAMVVPSISCHNSESLLLKRKNQPNFNTSRFFLPKASISLPSQTNSTLSPPPVPPLQPRFSLFHEVEHLCETGNLNEALQLLQRGPSNAIIRNSQEKADSISALLQACGNRKDLEVGRKTHEMVWKSNQLCHDFIINTRIITMYAMCGSPMDSQHVFDQLERRNLYQWNALISAYTRNELWFEAMLVFCDLIYGTDFKPDNYTVPCVVKACGGLLCLEVGKVVHGMAVKMGLASDAYVCNALIAMYGKCGHAEEGIEVFEKMPERNLVSWNAMIFGFSESGLAEESLVVFREMLEGGDLLRPDVATMVTILPVCAGKGDLDMGRVVHGLAVKLELDQDLMVNNALADMYIKCGRISKGKTLFDKNVKRNVVSWNIMIGGYARELDISRTFDLVRQMQVEEEETMRANVITILNVLPVFVEPCELRSLKELHGYAFRFNFQTDEFVANAFMASYAKCGSLSSADQVFYNMEKKTVSSWNALIDGCAQNGDPRKALVLFLQMTSLALEPDVFSIRSLLLACGHLKSLHNGKMIHGYVLRYGLEQDFFIGISLISLYSQCGKPFYKQACFNGLHERNQICWNEMIAGFSQNGLPDKAISLFRQMQCDNSNLPR